MTTDIATTKNPMKCILATAAGLCGTVLVALALAWLVEHKEQVAAAVATFKYALFYYVTGGHDFWMTIAGCMTAIFFGATAICVLCNCDDQWTSTAVSTLIVSIVIYLLCFFGLDFTITEFKALTTYQAAFYVLTYLPIAALFIAFCAVMSTLISAG